MGTRRTTHSSSASADTRIWLVAPGRGQRNHSLISWTSCQRPPHLLCAWPCGSATISNIQTPAGDRSGCSCPLPTGRRRYPGTSRPRLPHTTTSKRRSLSGAGMSVPIPRTWRSCTSPGMDFRRATKVEFFCLKTSVRPTHRHHCMRPSTSNPCAAASLPTRTGQTPRHQNSSSTSTTRAGSIRRPRLVTMNSRPEFILTCRVERRPERHGCASVRGRGTMHMPTRNDESRCTPRLSWIVWNRVLPWMPTAELSRSTNFSRHSKRRCLSWRRDTVRFRRQRLAAEENSPSRFTAAQKRRHRA